MPLANPQSADHLAAAAGEFEPQRSNNFTIEFPLPGNDKDLVVMSLVSFAMPTESNEEVEMTFQNERRWVAGKASVDTSTLTVRDFVDKTTRKAIMTWRKKVWDKATGKVGLAKNYKLTGYVILHGPDGSSQRIAKAVGCWPQSVTPGTLDYGSNDPVQIEVTLRVDKFIWQDGNL
jgi:hypothetical protein